MKKNYNIAIVGLGQVGLYLYNELKIKKKDIETKTGKQIKIVAISAKNKNKKRKFKIDKKIFYSNPLNIFKNKIDILIECIGLSILSSQINDLLSHLQNSVFSLPLFLSEMKLPDLL